MEKGCAALKNVQIKSKRGSGLGGFAAEVQEDRWPWVRRQELEGDLSVETWEAAAGHNPLLCPQHLPVEGVHMLSLSALKCTFSLLVIGFQVVGRVSWSCSEYISLIFSTAISSPLSRVADLKL